MSGGNTSTEVQMTIPELMELARTYADDGAFFSAARSLRRAADTFEWLGERQRIALTLAVERKP